MHGTFHLCILKSFKQVLISYEHIYSLRFFQIIINSVINVQDGIIQMTVNVQDGIIQLILYVQDGVMEFLTYGSTFHTRYLSKVVVGEFQSYTYLLNN